MLTQNYQILLPQACPLCQLQTAVFKYGRFSDVCVCSSCKGSFDAKDFLKGKIQEIQYKNLIGLCYYNNDNWPLVVILSGYGNTPRQSYAKSRYAKWADHFGFNLLYLSDVNLYWDDSYSENVLNIEGLIKELGYQTPKVTFIGFSNGGIQTAAIAVTRLVNRLVYISGFTQPALDILHRLSDAYLTLNPNNTIIVENLKDLSGFNQRSSSAKRLMTQKRINYTSLYFNTGHNLRTCGGDIFKLLSQTK